jgi:hypothetical protein
VLSADRHLGSHRAEDDGLRTVRHGQAQHGSYGLERVAGRVGPHGLAHRVDGHGDREESADGHFVDEDRRWEGSCRGEHRVSFQMTSW